jgi:hypothetical protein
MSFGREGPSPELRKCTIGRRAGLVALLLLSACNWGYGAPIDRATFASAELHEDGVRCVFALHDMVYRPAEGMRAFPDGGVPRYDVDRHKLGILDVQTGKTTVLVDRKNRGWLPGHGGFHVAGVEGRSALVRQGGQRRDYEHDHLWWRLDLDSGDLSVLAIDEEMRREGLAVGPVTLVDGDFTLMIVTAKGDRSQEVWSRRADGTLRRLAVTDHYYGTAEGQIWWYDVAERAGARTDYRTGETVHERRANFAMPRQDPVKGCKARFDHRGLILQEQVGGSWRDRVLPVEASALR